MSKFDFVDLNPEVRLLMLSEINSDIESGRFFISSRLNQAGIEAYPTLLMDAVKEGTEYDLQIELENKVYFNSQELRNGKPVKVPSNAAQLLAQSEFNRYFIRALCLKAVKENTPLVEIYRARESSRARPESEERIGNTVNASDLLEDLRSAMGAEPKLLPGINSGLSVKLQ